MSDVERHKARESNDDSIRVVSDPDAEFECSVCSDWVHRFSVKYHGENQYCPSCWDEIGPDMTEYECRNCGNMFEQSCYTSHVIPDFYLCDDCNNDNAMSGTEVMKINTERRKEGNSYHE